MSLCSICAVLFIGIGIWQQGDFTFKEKNFNNLGQTSTSDMQLMSTLAWNNQNNSRSRTSYISPITADCKEEEISKSDFFGFFDSTNGAEKLPKNSTHYVVKKDNEIYSLKAQWNSQKGKVSIIIDPNYYPEFLFTQDCKIETINGQFVVAHKSNFIGDTYEIDIGIKKSGVGVWIVGNSENLPIIETLLNMVLSSEIDFS